MSDDAIWYYSNAAKQPNGPVGIAQLKEAMHAPGWYERALIWRDGWPQWRPWKEVAAELGIPLPMHAEVTAPPPARPAPAPAPAPRPQASPLAATEIYPAPSAPASAPAAAPPRPPVSGQRPVAPAPAAAVALPDAIPESEMVYAGFWRRFFAILIDGTLLSFVLVPILAIALAILMPMMMASTANGEPNMGAMAGLFALYGFLFLLGGLYFVVFERSASGATLGKRIVGIRVVDKEGRRIGFGRALGRLLGKIVSGMPLYAGYLMAGFTGRKQALHDLIAGTLVIDKASRSQLGGKSGSGNMGLVIGLIVGAGIIGIGIIGILAAIALPAYQDYVMRAKVASAYAEAAPIKIAVSDYFVNNNSQCPSNGEGAIDSADSYYGLNIRRAEVYPGQDNNGAPFCLIDLTLAGDSKLYGKMMQLAMDVNQNWTCATADTDLAKWLPTSCKSQ